MTTNDKLPKAFINLGENKVSHCKTYVEPSAKVLIESFASDRVVSFSEALRAVIFAGLSHIYNIEFIPNNLIDIDSAGSLDPKIILDTQ